jgi:HSP20 family protein
MLVTRWSRLGDPWREFNRLHDEMNRLFDRFGADGGARPTLAVSYPALNVSEDADNLYAEAELPGMELSDLEIYVAGDNQLSIKGERKPPAVENATWHRQERGFGQFTRVITLPIAVDADRVSAEFSHGVLTIKMPKSAAAKPRRIPVKAE